MLRVRPGDAIASDDRGVALVTAVVVSFAVFSIMGIAIGLADHEESASARATRREQALAAAEAGINAAMSRLSADSAYLGQEDAALSGAPGEYSVEVSRLSPDPADARRYLVSVGYSPRRDAPQAATRRVEQEIALIPTDGFRHALFAGSGGISGANNTTVNGDVYSDRDLVLANRTTVSGSVTSLGTVTTAGNSTIGGDIRAVGSVGVDNPSTTVLGSIFSGGNVSLAGRVNGSVQAAGTISGGTVQGTRAPYSAPEPPRPQGLPTFEWDPANYASSQTWASPAEFQAHWASTTGAFSGHHRILCPAPCTTAVSLDAKWTVTDDVTIASDAPLRLSRDVANGAGRPVTLTIVSSSTVDPAIAMSNNLSFPADLRVVLFSPNAPVKFTNRQVLTGVVYASAVTLDQQFNLTFVPVSVPGFTWDVTSSSHFRIEHRSFKEVPT